MIPFNCPFCQQYLEAPEGSWGRRIQCMTCEKKFELDQSHVQKEESNTITINEPIDSDALDDSRGKKKALGKKTKRKISTRQSPRRSAKINSSVDQKKKRVVPLLISLISLLFIGVFVLLSQKNQNEVDSSKLELATAEEHSTIPKENDSGEVHVKAKLFTYPHLPCDPRTIIGVEQKSGKEDQGVKYFEDMSFGVSGEEIVQTLREMRVNNIRIPIMNKLREDDRADVIVDYVKKIHDAGGLDIGVILSVRRYGLISAKQQDRWCADVVYIYSALKAVNLHHMVVGCSFDENDNLRDKPSDKKMWDDRHRGILACLEKLNELTDGDFKKRTAFIHGKGMGSQFRGVKASSDDLNFPEEVKKQVANYCYNFKFFQTGFPEDISKQGWMNFLYTHCGFDELRDLGVALIFVGDSGDGIKGTAFESNNKAYGKCGPFVMSSLKQVFSDNSWTGFSFGLLLEENKARGVTILHRAKNGQMVKESKQVICWEYWRDSFSRK